MFAIDMQYNIMQVDLKIEKQMDAPEFLFDGDYTETLPCSLHRIGYLYNSFASATPATKHTKRTVYQYCEPTRRRIYHKGTHIGLQLSQVL